MPTQTTTSPEPVTPGEKTSHTSGPWTIHKSVDPNEVWVCTDYAPLSIAKVLLDIPAGVANARLIATAPELLEALEQVHRELLVAYAPAYCGPQGWTPEMREQRRLKACDASAKALAAIAKATGQPTA